jgi:hypothetical protein
MMAVGILAIASRPAHAADSARTSFLNPAISHSAPLLDAEFGCKVVKDKLVCGKDVNDGDGSKKHKKKNEGTQGEKGDGTQGTQGEKGDGTQGERSCPPGYVVLDKPNKYGAFCEPKEGLPETPKEKLACQFPGQVGDDCHCPPGTEFAGYKGCIVVRMKYCRKRTDLPGATLEDFMGFFELNCNTAGHNATSACTSLGTTGGVLQCCCEYDKKD